MNEKELQELRELMEKGEADIECYEAGEEPSE